MTDAAIKLQDVDVGYRSRLLFSGLNLEIPKGSFHALLGANGAGKTTLIRMLLGLLATSAGDVDVLGGPPDRSRRQRLGYVPQNLGLWRDLTADERLEGPCIVEELDSTIALPPGTSAVVDSVGNVVITLEEGVR